MHGKAPAESLIKYKSMKKEYEERRKETEEEKEGGNTFGYVAIDHVLEQPYWGESCSIFIKDGSE